MIGSQLGAFDRRSRLASGMWLVFAYPQDVDRWWSAISADVAADKLGPQAKIAAALQYSNLAQPRIICVYTETGATPTTCTGC